MLLFIMILLIICAIVLFGFHIHKHFKYNTSNEILQLNYFNKDLFEDYIALKQPLILMNTLTEMIYLKNYTMIYYPIKTLPFISVII